MLQSLDFKGFRREFCQLINKRCCRISKQEISQGSRNIDECLTLGNVRNAEILWYVFNKNYFVILYVCRTFKICICIFVRFLFWQKMKKQTILNCLTSIHSRIYNKMLLKTTTLLEDYILECNHAYVLTDRAKLPLLELLSEPKTILQMRKKVRKK